jgi:FMN phosphatase YigB (HAD superfamily)
MAAKNTVFLFDVDNTLLFHDKVTADLRKHLQTVVGAEGSQRYWQFFEQIRNELGYADYLGALQRYRLEYPRDPHLLEVSFFLLSYPFANRLFPASIDAVQHVQQFGTAVILSDGDVVFQPRKISRAGLYEVFDGNVLIYVHKEKELEDVERRYPADHYVMFDDKLRILDAMKKIWSGKLTTVFVRQGHYAHDAKAIAGFPPADITIETIGRALDFTLADLVAAGQPRASSSTV